MKQKDILLIAVVVIFGGVIALVMSNMLISNPEKRSAQVEVVDAINSKFEDPDKKYFYPGALNPTQFIRIGPGSDPTDPFAN